MRKGLTHGDVKRWGVKDTRRRVNGVKVKIHSVGQNGVKFATQGSKKCQCPVIIRITKRNDGVWVVRKVVLDHVGHTPTPSKTRHVCIGKMRSHLQYRRGCSMIGIQGLRCHRHLGPLRKKEMD